MLQFRFNRHKRVVLLLFCGIIKFMKTLVEKINVEQIQSDIMKEAGALIRRGELVAFPTETVYGLGADALSEEGAKKIYAAKGRPSDNPLIVHIAEFSALDAITARIPEEAKILADAFWPGPLTMIFQKNEKVPLTTTGGLETVAVRMPSHPVALALIREGGGYIAAPSANTSGRPSPTLASHVYEDLQGRIPLILDGGPVGIGLESTIVDLSGDVPMILRPGYITQEMLQEKIGNVLVDPGLIAADSTQRPKAPGMKYKHYAPKAQLTLIKGDSAAVVDKIRSLTQEHVQKGEKVGIIGTDETLSAYENAVVKNIGSRDDEDAIARHLYAVLREFDEEKVDVIFSEYFDTPRIGSAIMNRLLKAARSSGHRGVTEKAGIYGKTEKNNICGSERHLQSAYGNGTYAGSTS